MFHPAATHGVRRVSAHAGGRLRPSTALPRGAPPFGGFPSPTAVPCHHGRYPLGLGLLPDRPHRRTDASGPAAPGLPGPGLRHRRGERRMRPPAGGAWPDLQGLAPSTSPLRLPPCSERDARSSLGLVLRDCRPVRLRPFVPRGGRHAGAGCSDRVAEATMRRSAWTSQAVRCPPLEAPRGASGRTLKPKLRERFIRRPNRVLRGAREQANLPSGWDDRTRHLLPR